MNRTAKPTLAIIGAGIAGLTAARQCQKAGLSVTLYDKGRGVGGRCATRRRDDFAFDHGAQLIAASDSAFRGALRQWMIATAVQRWKGRLANMPAGITPYVGTPGMNAVPKLLARDLNVYLPVEIAEIAAVEGGQWGLSDVEGRLLGSYDAVLLTCPPEQAQRLSGSLFAPEIFERPVTMRAVWTVLAAFQRPVHAPYDAALLNEEPLAWVARNSAKPQREQAPDSWVLHAGSDISEQFIDHPREEVISDLLAAFEHELADPLPPTIYTTAHRWRFAKAEGQSLNGEISVFDDGLGLGMAGDWLNPPETVFYGFQSAWQSGMNAAARIKAWAKAR